MDRGINGPWSTALPLPFRISPRHAMPAFSSTVCETIVK
jgi:hypothetical protein